MRRGQRALLLAFLIFLPLSSSGELDPARGAKDLFFDTAGDEILAVDVLPPPLPGISGATNTQFPAAVNTLGLSYWIELLDENGGPGRRVTNQRVFRSGEAIRLHFVSNRTGRISLLQMGPSGRSSVLFPDPAKGLTDNILVAREERVLPRESAWFRFDNNTGEETLLAVFAEDQQDLDMTLRPESLGGTLIASAPSGSKDLVIEVEAQSVSTTGTYAVNMKGQPIVLEIILRHE